MKKVVTFILCIAPVILFFATAIPLLYISMASDLGTVSEETVNVLAMFLCSGTLLTVFMLFGVMIWLIIRVYRDKSMPTITRAKWVAVLYFLNMFVFPVYWFRFFRREE